MRSIGYFFICALFFLSFGISAFADTQQIPNCELTDDETEYLDDELEGDPGSSDPTLCLYVGKVSEWDAQFTDSGEVIAPGDKLFDIDVHWDLQDISDQDGEYILALFSGSLNNSIRVKEVPIDIEEEEGVFEDLWLSEEAEYFVILYKKSLYCFTESNCAPDEDVQEQWIESGDIRPLFYTLPPQEWGYFKLSPEEAKASSVVFLPGVQGSRLYVKEGNNFDKVWEPSGNNALKKLYFDMSSGESLYDIYIGEVIDSISISGVPINLGDVYDSFLDLLGGLERDNIVYQAEALAYDWRYDPKDIATKEFNYMDGDRPTLRNQVLQIANNSPTGKVTIIAHSYGGLVAKEIINSLGSNKIDMFITLGTPHLGTPKTISTILHGEGLNKGLGLIMRKNVGRGLAVSIDSTYILMPFPSYFDVVSDPVVTIEDSEATDYLFSSYGDSLTEYESFKSFIQDSEERVDPTSDDTNIPANIYPRGTLDTHQGILEDFSVISQVRYIGFVGWGVDTIKGINYYTRRKNVCVLNCLELDYEPVFTRDGDRTMVAQSAEGGSFDEMYYLDFELYEEEKDVGFKHLDMTEFPPLQDVLVELIEYSSGSVDTSNYILEERSDLGSSRRLLVSAHSPVEIQVTDIDGNVTGREELEGTDFFHVVEEVPGSFYLEFGEGKYVGVDFEDVSNITFNGIGSGDTTISVGDMYGEEKAVFRDIPTATSSVMTLTLSDDLGASTLEVDEDGDGTGDLVYSFAGEEMYVSEVVEEDVEESSEIGGGGGILIVNNLPEGRVLGESFPEEDSLQLYVEDLVAQSQVFLDSIPIDISEKYLSELSTLLDDLEYVLMRYTEMYE